VENLTLTGNAINGLGNNLNNQIIGNTLNNSLDGGTGNDKLNGLAGNDTLYGGTGNDTLDGGTGNDRMIGGTGDDTYYVDSATDTIVEDVNAGTDSVFASIDFSLVPLAQVENLYLTGNAISGIGNDLNNYVEGNTLNNYIFGGNGNDRLSASDGNDTVDGGTGNDTVWGGNGNDSLDAGIGNDELQGGTGDDILNGGDGNDNLWGDDGNDTLYGGTGNDFLDGRVGNDRMVGGAGDDIYHVDSINDVIVEEVNGGYDSIKASISFSIASLAQVELLILTDTAISGTGNDLNNYLEGNALNNTLAGGIGNDTLSAGDGNDTLDGGVGNDRLQGGNGNDRLMATSGADQVWGGTGADRFVLSKSNATSIIISDFSPTEGDTIQIGPDNSAIQLTNAQFLAGAGARTATTTSQRVIYNTTTGQLFYDADGSGTQFAPVLVATLTNKAALRAEHLFVSPTPADVTTIEPTVVAALARDTAPNGAVNSDYLTFDPTIQGQVSTPNQLAALKVAVNNTTDAAFIRVPVNSDGTFTISRSQLENIYGNRLSDETHTVYLRAIDSYNNVTTVETTFTLDTTSPGLATSNLIDGITWIEGEELKGQVLQLEPGTQVTYRFDDQPQMLLDLNAAGAFNKFLDIPDLDPFEAFSSHTLTVSSTDPAGNMQVAEYKFLVKNLKSAVDEDEWQDDSSSGSSSTGGSSSGTTSTGSSWIASGGSGGPWGRGGYIGNSDSGSGSGGSSSGGGGSSGSGYGSELPTYLEKMSFILDQAVKSIPQTADTVHKKAALKNRVTVLMELADMVDQGRFYDRMQPVLHTVFDRANNDPIVYEYEATEEGSNLATAIVQDPDAVKTEVYQAELLAVTNQVLIDRGFTPTAQGYQQMVNALLELGRTYAALNPSSSGASTSTTPDFLDSLWRAQKPSNNGIRTELQKGIAALDTLLEGINDPLQAIQFVNTLVQAATNVESLQGALRDAQFLQELVAFGFEYAKLNPTNLASATQNGIDAFLATLWQAAPTAAVTTAMRQATGKLSDIFKAQSTKEERIKVLKFQTNLLKAIGQSGQQLQEEKQNAQFLSALLELGGAYAALKPTTSATEEPLNFFLDTLWNAQGEDKTQEGSEQLGTFLGDSPDSIQMLKFSKNLLNVAEQVAELGETKHDSSFLNNLIDFGKFHKTISQSKTTTEGFFLDTLWQSQNEESFQKGIKEFKTFLIGSPTLGSWVVGSSDNPFRYQSPVLSAFSQVFPDKIDQAGYQLLAHWLYGNGAPLYVNNNSYWSDYMMRDNEYTTPVGEQNPFLPTVKQQIKGIIKQISNPITAISDTIFPLNLVNSYAPIGYAYLHGVSSPGLLIAGSAYKQVTNQTSPSDNFTITLNLSYTWVDNIDPNYSANNRYEAAFVWLSRAIALIERQNPVTGYHTEIQWTSEIMYQRVNGAEAFSGWPFTANQGLPN
jgi:Ca2+-binding RTX toxin-like protein